MLYLTDLSAVPHFTTLQKFFFRIKTLYLRYAFGKTLNLFYSNNDPIPVTAIDSSGFTSGYSNHYYSIRTGKIRKHFLKTSISVDTDQQVITGFIASKSRVHDTRHAGRLFRQCHKIRKSDCYVMDKGYYAEAIHRLIREDLHADLIIPIRSWNKDVVGGAYRQEMALQFDNVRYRKRQLVENKFSVLKRKFSGDLKARIFVIQKKEIAGKMIVLDKGYDSEEIHELIRDTLNSCSFIPVRNRKRKLISGYFFKDESLNHLIRRSIIKKTRSRRYSPS